MDVCGNEDFLMELILSHNQTISVHESRKMLMLDARPDIKKFLVDPAKATINVIPSSSASFEDFEENYSKNDTICIRLTESQYSIQGENSPNGLKYVSYVMFYQFLPKLISILDNTLTTSYQRNVP